MPHTHLIEAAERLLALLPGQNPSHCHDLTRLLQAAGEVALADKVKDHANSRATFPGGTTTP